MIFIVCFHGVTLNHDAQIDPETMFSMSPDEVDDGRLTYFNVYFKLRNRAHQPTARHDTKTPKGKRDTPGVNT